MSAKMFDDVVAIPTAKIFEFKSSTIDQDERQRFLTQRLGQDYPNKTIEEKWAQLTQALTIAHASFPARIFTTPFKHRPIKRERASAKSRC